MKFKRKLLSKFFKFSFTVIRFNKKHDEDKFSLDSLFTGTLSFLSLFRRNKNSWSNWKIIVQYEKRKSTVGWNQNLLERWYVSFKFWVRFSSCGFRLDDAALDDTFQCGKTDYLGRFNLEGKAGDLGSDPDPYLEACLCFENCWMIPFAIIVLDFGFRKKGLIIFHRCPFPELLGSSTDLRPARGHVQTTNRSMSPILISICVLILSTVDIQIPFNDWWRIWHWKSNYWSKR